MRSSRAWTEAAAERVRNARYRRNALARAAQAVADAAVGEDGPPRVGTINVFDTHVAAWEDVDQPVSEFPGVPAMVREFHRVLGLLRARGWATELDPQTLRSFGAICDGRWYGRKGDLEVDAQVSGRTFHVEFFQNVANVENRSGGRYDFQKFARMPRHLQTMVAVEMAAVVRRLLDRGYAPTKDLAATDPAAPLALRVLRVAEGLCDPADPLATFNRSWGADRFVRDVTGWPAVAEYERGNGGENHDRDGVPLRNGETRYFRDHRGRLQRGTVYTNMNSMWMVVYGGSVTYVHGSALFRCEHPERVPRRLVPGQLRRLQAELGRAVAANQYARVAVLARVLERAATRTGEVANAA